jgi:hypothetical protein
MTEGAYPHHEYLSCLTCVLLAGGGLAEGAPLLPLVREKLQSHVRPGALLSMQCEVGLW